ncbi:MAG: hypothetical protein LBR49_01085 [Tannerella sp.]|jgi:predicted nucleic acid-binding protein|nr:hypothetical protein [Tannerella sp.]
MKRRIYIDTSVIGGYYDVEFETASRQLFERIADREFDVYFSEINEAELENAPQQVKDVKNLIPLECFNFVEVNEEAERLTQLYISKQAKTMPTILHWLRSTEWTV